MITEEQFDEWIENLRSGKYKQGQHRLCELVYDNGVCTVTMCCLGVLADQLHHDWWSEPFITQSRGRQVSIRTWNEADSEHVPFDAAGLLDVLPYDVQERLSMLNDQGNSFSDIADQLDGPIRGKMKEWGYF